jgi:hypothetical protein
VEAKKLAIVGGGVTKDRAPFDDPNVIIWSTASVGLGLPRVDAIFELHDEVFPDEELAAANCYIWMKEKRKAVPMSQRFPIERLIEAYGKRFNGTVAMMLAFAALPDFNATEIELYGVDFSSDDEYSRRNMFYWLMGYLTARGIKITICPGGYMSDECTTYMYEDDGKAYLRDLKRRMEEQAGKDQHDAAILNERKIYARAVLDTIAQFERRN